MNLNNFLWSQMLSIELNLYATHNIPLTVNSFMVSERPAFSILWESKLCVSMDVLFIMSTYSIAEAYAFLKFKHAVIWYTTNSACWMVLI